MSDESASKPEPLDLQGLRKLAWDEMNLAGGAAGWRSRLADKSGKNAQDDYQYVDYMRDYESWRRVVEWCDEALRAAAPSEAGG